MSAVMKQSNCVAFDWTNPDYRPIFAQRLERLRRIRATSRAIDALKAFYAKDENIARFISDWGTTLDPRNAERSLPTVIPFILFPKQREWLNWTLARWRAGGVRPG